MRGVGVVVLVVASIGAAAGVAAAAPSWVPSQPASVAGETANQLVDVACPSAGACFAVGSYAAAGNAWPLVERWDGYKWTASAGAAGVTDSTLSAVTCADPTLCFAVGMAGGSEHPHHDLIERWDGTRWTVSDHPEPNSAYATLNAVACASRSACFAVGSYSAAVGTDTFTERWDGHRWTIVPSPAAGATQPDLALVGCTTPSSCVALGGEAAPGADHDTLVERWDGHSWRLEARITRAGATSVGFRRLSCPTAGECIAVGEWDGPGGARGQLVEVWNGSSWSATSLAGLAGDVELLGVACRGARDCTAVGAEFLHPNHTLVVHWDGSRWAQQPTTDPSSLSGYTGSALTSVACSSDTACISVGSYGRNGLANMLVDRYLLHAGYWLSDAAGNARGFGDAVVQTPALPATAVAVASTGAGLVPGYWVTDARGDVVAGAHARPVGSRPALASGEHVVAIAGTASAHGYWFFTNTGRVIPRGDAHSYGDLAGSRLNQPIIAAAATPTGAGYYLVGSDGGVFAYGDAHFHGSTAQLPLQRPVVGITVDATGNGYWLVASDGGVFSFGDAVFRGSMGGRHLNRPVVGATTFGAGYVMVASDGGVFDFSDQPFAGSAAGAGTAAVTGIAALVD